MVRGGEGEGGSGWWWGGRGVGSFGTRIDGSRK